MALETEAFKTRIKMQAVTRTRCGQGMVGHFPRIVDYYPEHTMQKDPVLMLWIFRFFGLMQKINVVFYHVLSSPQSGLM